MSPPPDASAWVACAVATAQAAHATSLCPRFKAISDDDTHNQRSEIALEVTGTSATPYPLPVHEMVDLPRAADSAPAISLIKRPDKTHRDHAGYGHLHRRHHPRHHFNRRPKGHAVDRTGGP
jgi:hypothetical protein